MHEVAGDAAECMAEQCGSTIGERTGTMARRACICVTIFVADQPFGCRSCEKDNRTHRHGDQSNSLTRRYPC
jgi:hypothetical protein